MASLCDPVYKMLCLSKNSENHIFFIESLFIEYSSNPKYLIPENTKSGLFVTSSFNSFKLWIIDIFTFA